MFYSACFITHEQIIVEYDFTVEQLGGLGVQKTCIHLLVEVGIYINQRFDDAMCDQTK